MSQQQQQSIMKWADAIGKDYGLSVTNLTKSWVDGKVFCAIVEYYEPNRLNYKKEVGSDSLANVKKAFEIFEALGIPQYLDAEDAGLEKLRHFHSEKYSHQNLTLPAVNIVEQPKPEKKVVAEKPKVVVREQNVPAWMKKLDDRKKGVTSTETKPTTTSAAEAPTAIKTTVKPVLPKKQTTTTSAAEGPTKVEAVIEQKPPSTASVTQKVEPGSQKASTTTSNDSVQLKQLNDSLEASKKREREYEDKLSLERDKLKQMTLKIQNLEKEVEEKRLTLKQNSGDVSKLNLQINQLEKVKADNEVKLKNLSKQIEEMEKINKSLGNSLTEVKNLNDKNAERIKKFEVEQKNWTEEKKRFMDELSIEKSTQNEKIQNLQREIQRLKESSNISQDIKDYEFKLEKLEAAESENKSRISNLLDEIDSKEQKLSAIKFVWEYEKNDLKKQNQTLLQELDDIKSSQVMSSQKQIDTELMIKQKVESTKLKYENEIKSLNSQLDSLKKELIQHKELGKAYDNEVTKSKNLEKELKSSKIAISNEQKKFENERKNFNLKIEKLEKSMNQLPTSDELNSLKKEKNKMSIKIENLTEENESLKSSQLENENRIKELQNSIKIHENKELELKHIETKLNEENAILKRELEEKTSLYEVVNTELANERVTNVAYQRQIEELTFKLELSSSSEIEELNQSLEKKEREIYLLRQELSKYTTVDPTVVADQQPQQESQHVDMDVDAKQQQEEEEDTFIDEMETANEISKFPAEGEVESEVQNIKETTTEEQEQKLTYVDDFDGFTGLEDVSVVNGVLKLNSKDLFDIPEDLQVNFGDQVEVLDLSFNSITMIENLSDFTKLKSLNLNNNELISLDGFPIILTLETLTMNDNLLTDLGELLFNLKKMKHLKHLSIEKNPGFPNKYTEPEEYEDFKNYIFKKLPSLVTLNSVTKDGKQEIPTSNESENVAREKVEKVEDEEIQKPKNVDSIFNFVEEDELLIDKKEEPKQPEKKPATPVEKKSNPPLPERKNSNVESKSTMNTDTKNKPIETQSGNESPKPTEKKSAPSVPNRKKESPATPERKLSSTESPKPTEKKSAPFLPNRKNSDVTSSPKPTEKSVASTPKTIEKKSTTESPKPTEKKPAPSVTTRKTSDAVTSSPKPTEKSSNKVTPQKESEKKEETKKSTSVAKPKSTSSDLFDDDDLFSFGSSSKTAKKKDEKKKTDIDSLFDLIDEISQEDDKKSKEDKKKKKSATDDLFSFDF